MNELTEHIYIDPSYDLESLDDFDNLIEVYDATTLKHIAGCPRAFQYRVVRGLGQSGTLSRFLVSGKALHEAMDLFMIFKDRDMATAAFKEAWGDTDSEPCPAWESHLVGAHLEIVLKNYYDYAETTLGDYKPIPVTMEDLDFTNIIAAKFRMLGEHVILGESSILYNIKQEGKPDLPYAIKPDIIVQNGGGNIYVMDHKTSSSYLSDWKTKEHLVSNQLRGYIYVLREILDRAIHGGIINWVYVGERASNPDFGGQLHKLSRYTWGKDHADEAIKNQRAWIKTIEMYKEMDYYPQHAGRLCKSCNFDKICSMEPELREGVIYTDFEEGTRLPFFSI